MEQIKVSLLVPAFNTEDYVSDCLRSLVSQTLREIEVIVVDDGSTDGTGRIADQYAASDSRVRVFHQTHQGVSQSRNTCLALARGQYVGFVDSDDWVSVDAFEQLWATAEKHSADIVLGSILYDYGDGRTCRMGDKGEVFPLGTEVLDGKTCFVELMKKGCYVPMVCGNLYRRAFIQAHPLLHFEGIFHEDEYFSPYALFYARRVVDFKPDFYFYRQHAHSIMHSDNLKQRATSLWYIGDRLKQFVADQIPFKGTGDVRTAYLKLAEMLCQRAQPLYEKELYTSNRKCLFIFSETSTAAQYGIGTYIRQLAQCFDPADWDVNVVTLHTFGREVQWEMEENVAYYEIPIPVELQSNWSSENEQLYSRSVFYYMTTRLSLSKTIYCHFNFVSHYDLALLFKERVHATVLFTMHCSDWSLDLLGDKEWLLRILANPKGRKDERIVRKFELEKKFIMDCCDRVIAIARHSYEMLRDLYGIPESRLIYIPNGIKDDYRKRSAEECRALREKYGFSEKETLILFVGRLDLVKGIVELIHAFKEPHSDFPETKLVVAGTGNFSRCMEAANPCWSDIIFTGFISKEQLYELYAIATVGVVPSLHEEFGYVAIEMMLNELPVIVNNTTGLKEIVADGEYGCVFDLQKETGNRTLKEVLTDILSDNQNNRDMGKGRNRVLEQYALSLFRKRILDVYRRI